MNNIKPYKKYKPSGIEWLGEIPEHWEVRKLKYIFSITKRISGELGHKVLSITQNGIKIKDIESGVGQLSMDYSKYQFVNKGDFAMNHMDLLTGYVDISNVDGVTSPDYRVFILNNDSSDKSYLLYMLQLGYKLKLFYSLGQGVSQFGRWRLPAENFYHFQFPIPTLPEQTTIAAFLDYKTAKIDRFIRKKKQLIKLLNEQKAGIINDAVTKGIGALGGAETPKTKMKPSGIEWLGDIPGHWEVRKLKYVADFQSGEMITSETISPEGEYAVFGGGGFRGYTDNYTNEGEFVLIGRQGALCGNIKYAKGKFWASEHAIVTYPKIKIENIFLGEALRICNLGKLSQTAAQPGIAIGQIKNVSIPVPPIQEQTAIVSHIEKETAKINTTIATIEKEIALVQEYRTALIAEAVTGKINVREYAFPNVAEEETYEELEEELSIAAEGEVEYETEENPS